MSLFNFPTMGTFAAGCLMLACAALDAGAQTSAPPPYLALTRLDRDGDQRVSEQEFIAAGAAGLAARFAGIDTNRDGALSPAELDVARAASEARLRRMAADDPARSEYAAMPAFEALDRDANGRVDPDEFVAAQQVSLRQRFQRLDENGDGLLTEAEFEAARRRFLNQVGRPPESSAP